ncbi:MAG: capsular biosynthesis protein CpsH [Flavobacteriaceae bacterium]|nr:MAG: capsular biosynthesis protein CpsH [Flavobacteriaceae bacterium]
MFKDKKILFFSASFFGYQIEIKNKLVALGADVDFFDERPKNTFWYKALIRLDKRIIKKRIEKYYAEIIQTTANKDYDFVFFLKAEVVTLEMLNELKRNQTSAKFILYLWDSIKNCESVTQLFPSFDKVLSFDRKDVIRNSFMTFRPLFYLDEYADISNNPKEIIHDITFIGTGHTDRYSMVMKVKEFCDAKNLKSYFFIYLQDVKIFLVRKILTKSFRKAKQKDFSFIPLGKNQIIEIIKESNCVLDVERAVQCGLTMRTIEVLGAKKKLITTNADIKEYDFYNEKNILVIDRKNPRLSMDFVNGGQEDIQEDIYAKYSIGNWLREVFE